MECKLFLLRLQQQRVPVVHLLAVLEVAGAHALVVDGVGDVAGLLVGQRVPDAVAADEHHPVLVRLLRAGVELVAGLLGDDDVAVRRRDGGAEAARARAHAVRRRRGVGGRRLLMMFIILRGHHRQRVGAQRRGRRAHGAEAQVRARDQTHRRLRGDGLVALPTGAVHLEVEVAERARHREEALDAVVADRVAGALDAGALLGHAELVVVRERNHALLVLVEEARARVARRGADDVLLGDDDDAGRGADHAVRLEVEVLGRVLDRLVEVVEGVGEHLLEELVALSGLGRREHEILIIVVRIRVVIRIVGSENGRNLLRIVVFVFEIVVVVAIFLIIMNVGIVILSIW